MKLYNIIIYINNCIVCKVFKCGFPSQPKSRKVWYIHLFCLKLADILLNAGFVEITCQIRRKTPALCLFHHFDIFISVCTIYRAIYKLRCAHVIYCDLTAAPMLQTQFC